jgi:HPt (histidine-containing phosphotransfer) domain-containing protein
MEQLRADYRVVVAADLELLRKYAEALRGDEADRATLTLMVDILHRIAGGAGVFGLTQLSERTHGLELDLNDWLGAPLTESYRAALPELREAFAQLPMDAQG